MTDEELIARLREIQGQAGLFASVAADRLAALVKARREDALELLAAHGQAQEAYEAQLKAEARAERLEAALRWAHDTLWEINTNNYDHDEVCRLNDASVEVILGIAPLIGETHGKPPEWWEARAIAALEPAPQPAPTAGERLIAAAQEALEGKVSVAYAPQPAPDAAAIREALKKVRSKLVDQDNAALLLGAEWALTMIEALLTEKTA